MANREAGQSSRPTLRDVARDAGLSVTQTSRALNGHADVAASTRRRAEEAARRIGYSPNLEARRLKMPDTRTESIGVVLDTASQRFSDPFFGELLASLADGAAAHGYELQLSAPLADEDPVAVYERAIRANRVDGFVVLRTALDDDRVRHLSRRGVPFVTFGRPEVLSGHPAVSERVDALRPAIDHLVALGHERIGCIAEPLEFAVAAMRHTSFVEGLRAHGLEVRPDYVVVAGYREQGGHAATAQLLALDEPPSAVVTFNDLLAIGALHAAEEMAVDVPGELSVVGFDDIHAAGLTTPPLTTLRHEDGAIGHKLVEQLLHAIEENGYAGTAPVTPQLVVRASTGPA